MMKCLYKVAEHIFSVEMGDVFGNVAPLDAMANYKPFWVRDSELQPDAVEIFNLKVLDSVSTESELVTLPYEEETSQEEENQVIVSGRTASGNSVFVFRRKIADAFVSFGYLECQPDYISAKIRCLRGHEKLAIDNSLMILYAIATAKCQTALFHGAVVSHQGYGYMFLGKSGTGKSTHARLWLKNIAGTELLNDDNPVVRIHSDGAWIYGSPWSGKTPCYKNQKMPLGAVVQLSQAPFNKIKRLKGVYAYAALVPSISGKRWDKNLADGLHATENILSMTVPAYYLECLPDDAAAKTCFEAVVSHDKR